MNEQRMLELLGLIDKTMSEAHCTTSEMILVARQMTISATAQLAEDNPGCDRPALIRGVIKPLEDMLKLRLTPAVFGPKGSA